MAGSVQLVSQSENEGSAVPFQTKEPFRTEWSGWLPKGVLWSSPWIVDFEHTFQVDRMASATMGKREGVIGPKQLKYVV